MLGFLKRKKKNKDDAHKKAPKADEAQAAADPKKKKKKKFSLKLVLLISGVLIAVGGSGFVVYKMWFSKKTDGAKAAPVYVKKELKNVNLPEEMLEFSFHRFPKLYESFVDYNTEVTLIDKEIERIKKIAQAYPDQKKITDKEIKVWKKAEQTLKKAFIKLEKPVKESYVLFRVSPEQGLAKIKEIKSDLAKTAKEALAPVQEITTRLKQSEPVPKGLIKGTYYKLKKKFL